MAPPRDYRAEYKDRLDRARARNLPTDVARGHGPVPTRIAEALERQRNGGKALSAKDQAKYRKGIGQYEKRQWGSLETGRTVGSRRRGRLVPRFFASRSDAQRYLREHTKPTTGDYATFREHEDGRWTVVTLQ